MEATGVYWKPVWHILDDGELTLTLANARDVRNMPGRKTDANDATWLAALLAHGLVRPSFVAPQPLQELRDLTRTSKQLVRETAQHTQRIQKVLEDCNLKLSSVLTDILGKSGRAILNAIVSGQSDPKALAALALGKARLKQAEVELALRGQVRDHHRRMIQRHLKLIDAIAETIREVDADLGKALDPMKVKAKLLTTIPGVSDLTA